MALNVKTVSKLSKPGRYSDGDGLYAQVTKTGRSWVFRIVRGGCDGKRGRERWMGIGPPDDVSLEETRDGAAAARKQLWQGIDPIDAKQAERDTRTLEAAKNIEFETAAECLLCRLCRAGACLRSHSGYLRHFCLATAPAQVRK